MGFMKCQFSSPENEWIPEMSGTFEAVAEDETKTILRGSVDAIPATAFAVSRA